MTGSSSLAVPLFVLPCLFAISIGLAAKPLEPHLLGFLSVLACIWMGASVSLMSIVNEREVFDHERQLFLGIAPYVSAKTIVLAALSIAQTFIFTLLLCGVRLEQGMEWLDGGFARCFFYLALVGWAAVGMGVLISALAGRSRPLANFVLPLVMMMQIVFSVQVAGQGDAFLQGAIGEFHWTNDRPRSRDDRIDLGRPNPWAARASYATLSRYGDIAVRSFAYFGHESAAHNDEYRQWRKEARRMLIVMILGLPVVAIVVLHVQGSWWAIKVKLIDVGRYLQRLLHRR